MKKIIIYIPLALILIIQVFDKKDEFNWVQYLLLLSMIFLVVMKYFVKKESKK